MKSYEIALLIMVATGCAIGFNLACASTPSADDAWRAMGTIGAAMVGGWMVRKGTEAVGR